MIVTSLVVAQVKGEWDVDILFQIKKLYKLNTKFGKGPLDPKFGPGYKLPYI